MWSQDESTHSITCASSVVQAYLGWSKMWASELSGWPIFISKRHFGTRQHCVQTCLLGLALAWAGLPSIRVPIGVALRGAPNSLGLRSLQPLRLSGGGFGGGQWPQSWAPGLGGQHILPSGGRAAGYKWLWDWTPGLWPPDVADLFVGQGRGLLVTSNCGAEHRDCGQLGGGGPGWQNDTDASVWPTPGDISRPVFRLLLGVSSGCARPITGQVTSVTWPVIGWA